MVQGGRALAEFRGSVWAELRELEFVEAQIARVYKAGGS